MSYQIMSDELSIKWMRLTMVDEMNGKDFDLWTQQRSSGGKPM